MRAGLPGRRSESQGGHHGAKRDGRPRRSLPSTRTLEGALVYRPDSMPTPLGHPYGDGATAGFRRAGRRMCGGGPARLQCCVARRVDGPGDLQPAARGHQRPGSARCAAAVDHGRRLPGARPGLDRSRGGSPASRRGWPRRHASEHCSFCSRAWAFWLRASLATTAAASSRPARRGSTRGRSPGITACMTP